MRPNLFLVQRPNLFLVQYKKQIGTHREKKRMLTLTPMLVRRKSACKTSASSCKILRWLTPLLGPNLDPKTGPKQSPKRRNECDPIPELNFGSIFGPKNGVSHRRILQLPTDVLQADLRRTSMSVSVNTRFFSLRPNLFLVQQRSRETGWKTRL